MAHDTISIGSQPAYILYAEDSDNGKSIISIFTNKNLAKQELEKEAKKYGKKFKFSIEEETLIREY